MVGRKTSRSRGDGRSVTACGKASLNILTKRHPDEAWMIQVARNVTMEEWGFLSPGQYLIHDRDGKYCPAFQQIIDGAGIPRVPLPPQSPNLNAYAERWVRSVKEECLSRLILFGEASL